MARAPTQQNTDNRKNKYFIRNIFQMMMDEYIPISNYALHVGKK